MRADPLRDGRRVHRAALGIGAGAGALALAVTVAALAHLSVAAGGGHALRLFGADVATPAAGPLALLEIALAALGIAVVLAGLRAAATATLALRRLRRALLVRGPLAQDPSVLVVEDMRAAAFCAGLWRPRVYVTSGALALLDDAELAAVLAHEHAHRARRDPLRVVSIQVLSRALFFVPALRALGERFAVLAELAADDQAIATLRGDRVPLASAMLAFGEQQISAARVDRLAGDDAPAWRLPLALGALSAAAMAALTVLLAEVARHAAGGATVTVPALAGKPCVVTLAALPAAALMLARDSRQRT